MLEVDVTYVAHSLCIWGSFHQWDTVFSHMLEHSVKLELDPYKIYKHMLFNQIWKDNIYEISSVMV